MRSNPETLYTTLVGVSSSKSSLENGFAVFTKTKHSHALWPKIFTHTQQKWVNMCKKKTKTFMFGIAQTWKLPRCSSPVECLNKLDTAAWGPPHSSKGTMTTGHNPDVSRHNAQRMKQTRKKTILCDFIYIKYKTGLLLQDNGYPQWL